MRLSFLSRCFTSTETKRLISDGGEEWDREWEPISMPTSLFTQFLGSDPMCEAESNFKIVLGRDLAETQDGGPVQLDGRFPLVTK